MDDYSEQTDFQTHNNSSAFPHYGYQPQRSNAFIVLSLVMGLLAVTSCSFIFFACIFGGLSILFAILSKGNDRHIQILPKIGIVSSVAGIVLSVFVTAAAFYFVMNDTTFRKQLNETCEQIYGESFDDMLREASMPLPEQER